MDRCERTRELLWPLDRPVEVDPGVEEARAHLEGCPACRAFFERDAALGRALGGASLAAEAPPGLRDRAMAAIEAEPVPIARRGLARRAASWVVAAAAVLVAAFGLSRLGLGVSAAEASYIADYRHHHDGDQIVPEGGPDLEQTYELFRREFGVLVTPVVYDLEAASRAMVCLIDGDPAATVEYEIEGHQVAHYRVPVGASSEGLEGLTSSTDDELCIVRWSDERFEHALVSDMADDRLRRLAVERFGARD